MATDIISAAPAGIASEGFLATGAFVASGNAVSLTLGIMPRRVEVIDETKGLVLVKHQGSSPNVTVKNGAIDNTGIIVFPKDAGLNEPGSTVLIAAGTFAPGDLVSFAVTG